MPGGLSHRASSLAKTATLPRLFRASALLRAHSYFSGLRARRFLLSRPAVAKAHRRAGRRTRPPGCSGRPPRSRGTARQAPCWGGRRRRRYIPRRHQQQQEEAAAAASSARRSRHHYYGDNKKEGDRRDNHGAGTHSAAVRGGGAGGAGDRVCGLHRRHHRQQPNHGEPLTTFFRALRTISRPGMMPCAKQRVRA